jgi:hypothetical protein
MIDFKFTKMPPPPEKVIKSLNFGIARGLTKTAGEGQQASIGAIKGTFTVRSPWYEPRTPVGIKREIATPTNLKARVHTSARFLQLHETGGDKIPYKNYLAIPTTNARKTKQSKIPSRLLPKNLRNAFVIVSKGGVRLLCVRKGTGKKSSRGVVPMYVLVKKSKIKEQSVFYKPIEKVVMRRLSQNVADSVAAALSDIR